MELRLEVVKSGLGIKGLLLSCFLGGALWLEVLAIHVVFSTTTC